MEKIYLIEDILKLLPHRFPFILIDRILTLVPGKSITALKNVTINEPFFQGHFPHKPIMPGVLILESMCQAGGVLAHESLPPENKGKLIYLTGIDHMRFRKPVIPGDQLWISAHVTKQKTKVFKMEALVTVDQKRVAEAELMATVGEEL